MTQTSSSIRLFKETCTTIPGKVRAFSKWRLIKNLLVVSIGSLLLLGSEDVLLTFQSTINREKGVGIASVGVQYTFSVISSLFLPKYLILRFGSKIVMVLSMVAFLPFFIANYFSQQYYLMILSSVSLGLGYSLFMGSVDLYINNLVDLFSRLPKKLSSNSKETEVTLDYIEKFKSLTPKFKTSYSKCSPHQIVATIKYEKNEIPDCGGDNNKAILSSNTANVKTSENNTKKCKIRSLESTTVRFFSFYSMFYQTCYIWSNLMSFYILQSDPRQNHYSVTINSTFGCGADYCNLETAFTEHNLQQPSVKSRNILITVVTGLSILAAAIVTLFLEELKPKNKNVHLSFDHLLASFRQMKQKNQLLLLPLSLHIGMMKGFYIGDLTQSYIGCAWNIQHVGLVTACAGAMMAISSTISGQLVAYFGRLSIFITAAILNLALNVMLLLWHPDPNQPAMFFVVAGLWGCLFGIFHTQVRAIYGVLFKDEEEAAFGVYQVWYCIGGCMCLCYSDFICNDIKIYLMTVVFTVGMLGYFILEKSSFKRSQNICLVT